MILHTVALHSAITPPVEYEKPCYIKVDGCICECVKSDDYIIKRLITTDLRDYLRFSPGQGV